MVSMQDNKYRYMIDVACYGEVTAAKLWEWADHGRLVARKENAPFQPLLDWHAAPPANRFLGISEDGQKSWRVYFRSVEDFETVHSRPSDKWLELTHHVFHAFIRDFEKEGEEEAGVKRTSEETEDRIEEALSWPQGLRGVEALNNLVVPAMRKNPEGWHTEFEVFVDTTPIPGQIRRFATSNGVFNAISQGKRVRWVKPKYRKVQLIDGRIISWPEPITVEPAAHKTVWTASLQAGGSYAMTYGDSEAPKLFNRGLLFDSREKADEAGRAFQELFKAAT